MVQLSHSLSLPLPLSLSVSLSLSLSPHHLLRAEREGARPPLLLDDLAEDGGDQTASGLGGEGRGASRAVESYEARFTHQIKHEDGMDHGWFVFISISHI